MKSHELAKTLLKLPDSDLFLRIHFDDKKKPGKTLVVGAEFEEIVNNSHDGVGFGGSGEISLLSCSGSIQDSY